MHGKGNWVRPASAFFVAATMGLMAWGILGGQLLPESPGVTVPRATLGGVPALVAPNTPQPVQRVRWCDEGLGRNDAQ